MATSSRVPNRTALLSLIALGLPDQPRTRVTAISGIISSTNENRESTRSRMNALTGPRSRAGRYFGSPPLSAARIFWLESIRPSRLAAASSLRVRGTLARAFAAASASLRVGVGRPFPPSLISGVSAVASVLARRNNEWPSRVAG